MQHGMQELIDAELTAAIGAALMSGPIRGRTGAMAFGPGCCQHQPVTSSCASPRCGLGRSSRRCWNVWTALLRSLRDRSLHGVRLVISDAHAALKASIARVFVHASCQCCKHPMRQLLGAVPAASKDMVAATVRTIFAQPDAATTRSQLHDVIGLLDERLPKAAELLAAVEADVCAPASFAPAHGRKSSRPTRDRLTGPGTARRAEAA
jgi:hypothetical protein